MQYTVKRAMYKALRLVAYPLAVIAFCQQAPVSGIPFGERYGQQKAEAGAMPSQKIAIGEIEFFGYQGSGLNLATLRDALPIHEGQYLLVENLVAKRTTVGDAVQKVTGQATSDFAPVCCDEKGRFIIYIGLNLKRTSFSYNPTPTGKNLLPANIIDLHRRASDALMAAVMAGTSGEDRSKGYSLSDDPKARTLELEMRDWVLHHHSIAVQVLDHSANVEHRQAAAELIGYGNNSRRQVDVLVHASHDPDSGVRNNALRALAVLAGSQQGVAAKIPGESFCAMLTSGSWTDRNKAGALLLALTQSRDKALLDQLHREAMDSLMEMARWRSSGHAFFARLILGRIAGISDADLNEMANNPDQTEKIVAACG